MTPAQPAHGVERLRYENGRLRNRIALLEDELRNARQQLNLAKASNRAMKLDPVEALIRERYQ